MAESLARGQLNRDSRNPNKDGSRPFSGLAYGALQTPRLESQVLPRLRELVASGPDLSRILAAYPMDAAAGATITYFQILKLNVIFFFTTSACQSMKRNAAVISRVIAPVRRLFHPSVPCRRPVRLPAA